MSINYKIDPYNWVVSLKACLYNHVIVRCEVKKFKNNQ